MRASIIGVGLAVTVLLLIQWYAAAHECERRGGVFARTSNGYECLDVRRR